MARGTMTVKVPTTEEPALIFNELVKQLAFEPLIWDDHFKEWGCKDFQTEPSLSIHNRYGTEVVELRENGRVTRLPLEITRSERKPDGYNALTHPTTATPAIMQRKKPVNPTKE